MTSGHKNAVWNWFSTNPRHSSPADAESEQEGPQALRREFQGWFSKDWNDLRTSGWSTTRREDKDQC